MKNVHIGYLLEYTVHMDVSEDEWTIWFHPQESSISCSCKKFEQVGILCCHTLTLFSINNVKMILDQYILKRWTNDIKVGIVHYVKGRGLGRH